MIEGMEFKTTFWDDFSIADRYGEPAIKDTFVRAFYAWRADTEFVTELVLVLNWKCWYWYGKNNSYSKLYSDLYYKADGWCKNNLKGDDARYYFEMTD